MNEHISPIFDGICCHTCSKKGKLFACYHVWLIDEKDVCKEWEPKEVSEYKLTSRGQERHIMSEPVRRKKGGMWEIIQEDWQYIVKVLGVALLLGVLMTLMVIIFCK